MSQIDQRQMLSMGTVLDNRYRIVRYLASGGFGNTYVAEDMRLGGQVAVKEFFMRGTNHRSIDGTTVEVSNETNTPVFNTQLKKFQREARRIFELKNDNIIQVSDLFDANGTSYYVMKLINGTSLGKHTLSEQEARCVILQVLDALEAMHNVGIYHLDVKPGNIMREANGHCTLIDFGASKQLSADDRNTLSSSTMAYTPGFAPVEQIAQQSNNIGPWTDFYALGATLYNLVTGTPPPMVPVTDFAPNGRKFPYPETVSNTLRHAISTLMNPIHTLRPQTADQVRALLAPQKRTPPKGLWYALAGMVAVALFLSLFGLLKGCGDNDKYVQDVSDTSSVERKDTIQDPSTEEHGKNVPPPPTSFKTCPDGNHPHKIDLGLPSGTLWACCNVGATKPEGDGDYYAWGETTTKSDYNWNTYEHCDGTEKSCHNLGTSICGTQYDVAYVKLGSSWQMPTADQFLELLNNCKNEWAMVNGVSGRRFTGPNGGNIFMPAAGCRFGTDLHNRGAGGGYWSGTQSTVDSYDALILSSDAEGADRYGSNRHYGRNIRPISNN